MVTKPIGPGPSAKFNNRPPVDTPPVGKDVGPVAKFDPVGFGQEHKDIPPIGKDIFPIIEDVGMDDKPAPIPRPYDIDAGGFGIEFVSFDENIHSIYDDLAEWQGGY